MTPEPLPTETEIGLIPSTKRALLKNWKTSLAGVATALVGFVAFSPATFGGEDAVIVQVCKYLTLSGIASIGIVSKDYGVTGGTRPQ